MIEFEQNEIDNIESVDLAKLKTCENCKGKKQFKKYTDSGLEYGYVCPNCKGKGYMDTVAPDYSV